MEIADRKPGGGVKRFAYPGSRRLDSVDAKLHAAADTNRNHAADKNKSTFNFDDVWSIQKDVNVGKARQSPKQFYSRHTAYKGTDKFSANLNTAVNLQAPQGMSSGSSWKKPAALTFSYSQGRTESPRQAPASRHLDSADQSNKPVHPQGRWL